MQPIIPPAVHRDLAHTLFAPSEGGPEPEPPGDRDRAPSPLKALAGKVLAFVRALHRPSRAAEWGLPPMPGVATTRYRADTDRSSVDRVTRKEMEIPDVQ